MYTLRQLTRMLPHLLLLQPLLLCLPALPLAGVELGRAALDSLLQRVSFLLHLSCQCRRPLLLYVFQSQLRHQEQRPQQPCGSGAGNSGIAGCKRYSSQCSLGQSGAGSLQCSSKPGQHNSVQQQWRQKLQ